MRKFARIERLPPYVFNITNELKMTARRAGEDVIDMSMGNPDGPTPKHIVAKLLEAAQRADTHGYSVSKGIPRLRRAICGWYQRRYGVEFRACAARSAAGTSAATASHSIRIRKRSSPSDPKKASRI